MSRTFINSLPTGFTCIRFISNALILENTNLILNFINFSLTNRKSKGPYSITSEVSRLYNLELIIGISDKLIISCEFKISKSILFLFISDIKTTQI